MDLEIFEWLLQNMSGQSLVIILIYFIWKMKNSLKDIATEIKMLNERLYKIESDYRVLEQQIKSNKIK